MAAVAVLDQQFSATDTTDLLDLRQESRPFGHDRMWFWLFTTPSGSGVNELTLEFQVIPNIDDASATNIVFPLNQTQHFMMPPVVTAQMISDATNNELMYSYRNPALFNRGKLQATYSGAGSNVFRVRIWAGDFI